MQQRQQEKNLSYNYTAEKKTKDLYPFIGQYRHLYTTFQIEIKTK